MPVSGFMVQTVLMILCGWTNYLAIPSMKLVEQCKHFDLQGNVLQSNFIIWYYLVMMSLLISMLLVQTNIVLHYSNIFSIIWCCWHCTSFIFSLKIHKEEVRDLLDPNSANRQELANGHAAKVHSPGKPPIQIRETSNGVITLAGSSECSVKTLKEMADCLEQGSLSRATGSTNMNNQSRFVIAIFIIVYLLLSREKLTIWFVMNNV